MKLHGGFYVHNIPKRYSWNMVVLVVLLLLAVLRPVQPEDDEHFGPFSEVRKNYISFLFSSSPFPSKKTKKSGSPLIWIVPRFCCVHSISACVYRLYPFSSRINARYALKETGW